MTFWNAGLFLVIKRLWEGIIIVAVGVLALWKLVDLLMPIMERASKFVRYVTHKQRTA
jgi:hypothetical protein